MELVGFKKLHENAKFPERGSELAGGWDVTTTEIEKVRDDFYICKLGFSLELPKGKKLTLIPRSSQTKTRWMVINSPGLGDEDYRGEYQYRFTAIPSGVKEENGSFVLTYDEFPFKVGDRIGQVYLEDVIPIKFFERDELTETKRGEGGFGSTNK